MTTGQDLGWGNPTAPGYRTAHIVTIHAGGVALAVRAEVAHIFAGFITDLCGTGYRLDVRADDWGYALRCIRGTGPGTGRPCVLSNHSWGLAVDLNAANNPMTSDGIAHTDMPPETSHLAEKWGLRWGANYTGTRRDSMHFEFTGTPADVSRYPIITTQEDDMTDAERAQLALAAQKANDAVNYAVDAQSRLVALEAKVDQLLARP